MLFSEAEKDPEHEYAEWFSSSINHRIRLQQKHCNIFDLPPSPRIHKRTPKRAKFKLYLTSPMNVHTVERLRQRSLFRQRKILMRVANNRSSRLTPAIARAKLAKYVELRFNADKIFSKNKRKHIRDEICSSTDNFESHNLSFAYNLTK